MFVAYKIKHEDLSTLTATFHSLAKPTHYIQIILNLCTLFAHLSIRTLQMMLYVALCMTRFIYFYNFLDLFCNGKRWISTCIYLCCIGKYGIAHRIQFNGPIHFEWNFTLLLALVLTLFFLVFYFQFIRMYETWAQTYFLFYAFFLYIRLYHWDVHRRYGVLNESFKRINTHKTRNFVYNKTLTLVTLSFHSLQMFRKKNTMKKE